MVSKKGIHKGTWKMPGTNGINQIDHIIVCNRWATDIENVRTYRGVTSDSDHFLVGATLKQKITLIIRNRTEYRKRWNVEKFDETDVECQYQQEVQRKLQEKSPSNNKEEEWTYTGCHRRNGPNFGRVFLMLNYTDITQNTYIQS